MSAPSSFKALALACALLPCAALATIVMHLSLEDMAQRSTAIVRGTVQTSKAVDPGTGPIWTVTTLAVTERLKGPASATITLKQPGGTLNGLTQRVSGTASFTEGEDVLVFLEPSADEKGVFVVLGLASGKVGFEVVNGQKIAVRHLDGLSFANPGSRHIEAVENLEKLGAVDAFMTRIRAASRGAN
jgi:hypothetical protein